MLSACLLITPMTSFALCEELSRVGTADEGSFFVACKNTFPKPNYLITEFHGGGQRNSFVSFRDGRFGFMCSMGGDSEDCQSLPRGGLEFKSFDVKPGLRLIIEDIEGVRQRYLGVAAAYAYPRSARGAASQGCYLRIYGEAKVVFGFDKKRLHAASSCLVAFERYLASNKRLFLN